MDDHDSFAAEEDDDYGDCFAEEEGRCADADSYGEGVPEWVSLWGSVHGVVRGLGWMCSVT